MRPSATLTASMVLLLIQSATADFLIMRTLKTNSTESVKPPLKIGIVPTNDAGCDKQSTFTQNLGWDQAGNATHKAIKNTNCQTDTVEHSELLNFEHGYPNNHWAVTSTEGDIGVCVPATKDKGAQTKGYCDTADGKWSYKAIYECTSHQICRSSVAEKRWVA